MKKAGTDSQAIRQDSAGVDERASEVAYAVGPVCQVELPERPAAALANIVERRGQGEFVYVEAGFYASILGQPNGGGYCGSARSAPGEATAHLRNVAAGGCFDGRFPRCGYSGDAFRL